MFMKCLYCQSKNIEQGILVHNQDNPTLKIGLMYQKNQFRYEVEPLYVDLCTDCGTIIRTYVKGDVKDKKWEKELWHNL